MGYNLPFSACVFSNSLNHGCTRTARGYYAEGHGGLTPAKGGAAAEFASANTAIRRTRHQREVGTGYFDLVRRPHQRRHLVDPALHTLPSRAFCQKPIRKYRFSGPP